MLQCSKRLLRALSGVSSLDSGRSARGGLFYEVAQRLTGRAACQHPPRLRDCHGSHRVVQRARIPNSTAGRPAHAEGVSSQRAQSSQPSNPKSDKSPCVLDVTTRQRTGRGCAISIGIDTFATVWPVGGHGGLGGRCRWFGVRLTGRAGTGWDCLCSSESRLAERPLAERRRTSGMVVQLEAR